MCLTYKYPKISKYPDMVEAYKVFRHHQQPGRSRKHYYAIFRHFRFEAGTWIDDKVWPVDADTGFHAFLSVAEAEKYAKLLDIRMVIRKVYCRRIVTFGVQSYLNPTTDLQAVVCKQIFIDGKPLD